MKSQKMNLLVSLMIVTSLVAGCTQMSKPSIDASSQVIITTLPTATIVSSPSQAPTLRPMGTPTLVPTLPVDEVEKKFLEVLSSNGSCRLPCLWGITPGEENYQEAQAILSPFTSISGTLAGFLPEGGVISPNYTEDDLKLSTIVDFNIETTTGNRIVSRVGFKARGFQGDDNFIYDSALFGERMRAYMLPTILSEHGIPAAVLISTDGGYERGKNVPGFYVVLLYPEMGIMAAYTTYRQLDGGNVRGCLANAHVEIHLAPSGQPDAFAETLAQTQWKNLWPDPQDSLNWKHVETATSLTLEEFYEVFRQPTEMCLETPLILWPTPDN
ncbi:MAG: hypothetical protein KGZ53_06655 [Peptococcaceae bacterium]|nr:hypothetical protein [Peptococcaceae bacterium]